MVVVVVQLKPGVRNHGEDHGELGTQNAQALLAQTQGLLHTNAQHGTSGRVHLAAIFDRVNFSISDDLDRIARNSQYFVPFQESEEVFPLLMNQNDLHVLEQCTLTEQTVN